MIAASNCAPGRACSLGTVSASLRSAGDADEERRLAVIDIGHQAAGNAAAIAAGLHRQTQDNAKFAQAVIMAVSVDAGAAVAPAMSCARRHPGSPRDQNQPSRLPARRVGQQHVDGRSPGSRVLARGRLPGFPVVCSGLALADHSCGGSRGLRRKSRTAFPKSLLSENRHLLDTDQAKARQSESCPPWTPSRPIPPCPD